MRPSYTAGGGGYGGAAYTGGAYTAGGAAYAGGGVYTAGGGAYTAGGGAYTAGGAVPLAAARISTSGTQAIARQKDGHPDVAMKNAPGGGGTVVGTIPNGQTVTILQELGEFCQVSYSSYTGYVKLANLIKVDGTSSQTGGAALRRSGTGGEALAGGGRRPSGGGGGRPVLQRRGSFEQKPAEWIWKGQRYTSVEELEAAVQAEQAAAPNTLHGMGLKAMLEPEHKDKLQAKIKQLFVQYAGSDMRLQKHEMFSLAAALAAQLRIPQSTFGNLNLMFYRYDFSGGGDLNEEEGIMLIEGMLRQYRDSQDSERLSVAAGTTVPYKNMEDGYQVVRQLGKGGQGEVFLATDKSNGQEKVVKTFNKAELQRAGMALDEIIDEFALMAKLDHPKIARTYEIFQDAAIIYQISEPYFGGDLTKVVEQARSNGVEITAPWLTAIWKQVGQGLVFLHSTHMMHCDLKEANVMISGAANWSAPNVVLIDFGCAKSLGAEAKGGGTPGYMPPEVWTHNLWTTKGDTFSFGVMMYRMFTGGRMPFGEMAFRAFAQGCSQEEMCRRCSEETCAAILPATPSQLAQHPGLNNLLIRMLAKDFKQRPTMKAVLDDEWFRSQGTEDASVRAAARKLSNVTEKNDLFVALLADQASRENLAQLEDVSKLFADLDDDHSGELDPDEFRKGMRGKMDSEKVEELIKVMIGDNGTISYTKFMGHMIAQKHQSTTRMLYKLFQEIDQDGNGTLDLNELEQMLQKPQVKEIMAGYTAQKLMGEIVPQGNREVTWPDFQKYLDKRFSAPQQWKVGDDAEYLSTTHNCWVPTKVTNVHPPSGAIMVACKPNFWLDKPTQEKSIKRATAG